MNLNNLAKNTLCIAIVMFSVTVSTHIKNSVYKMENELKEREKLSYKERIEALTEKFKNDPVKLAVLSKIAQELSNINED